MFWEIFFLKFHCKKEVCISVQLQEQVSGKNRNESHKQVISWQQVVKSYLHKDSGTSYKLKEKVASHRKKFQWGTCYKDKQQVVYRLPG